MKVVTVSGTYIQGPEGKPEFRLGPGSYFMQPGGNYRHTTTCDKAADCVFFVESKGKLDLEAGRGGKGAGAVVAGPAMSDSSMLAHALAVTSMASADGGITPPEPPVLEGVRLQ